LGQDLILLSSLPNCFTTRAKIDITENLLQGLRDCLKSDRPNQRFCEFKTLEVIDQQASSGVRAFTVFSGVESQFDIAASSSSRHFLLDFAGNEYDDLNFLEC
jgi:hypothetical protein